MEKLKAIVIKSQDKNEKDKSLVLFSVEKGKFTANLKGVKGANAKLKACGQLFTFGEFEVVFMGENATIVGCEIIESFYNISSNIDAYFEACLLLQVVDYAMLSAQKSPELFVELLKALKTLCFYKTTKNYVSSKFLLKVFDILGFKINFDYCANCGADLILKRFLNLDSGEIVCLSCKMPNCVEISKAAHLCMKILMQTEYEKLETLHLALMVEEEILNMLSQNFKERFNKTLKIY